LTPDLPLEFLVHGAAVSLHASSRSRAAWKATVAAAARAALKGAWALTGRVSITIYYFPKRRRLGDVDNIVKPLLDGMSACIYIDDSQVERIVVQKFEPEYRFPFATPTLALSAAVDAPTSVVYVRVTDDPFEDLI
jgi:crossover junction endodeoxyribonuclease RusA